MNKKIKSEKPKRTQLTFSLTEENKKKLQKIAIEKGLTMAGVLSNWIAEYDLKEDETNGV